MKFLAKIDIMPHAELLDPQGKTIAKNLKHIDIDNVDDVRIGKHVETTIEAQDEVHAREQIDQACKRLLANINTETYTYHLDLLQ